MNSEKEIQTYFERIGLTDDELQTVYNLAREWAEKAVCTIQEIAEEIAYLVQKTAETLVDVAGRILEEPEEAISVAETEPRAQRRNANEAGRGPLNRDTERRSGGANVKGPIAGFISRPKADTGGKADHETGKGYFDFAVLPRH